MVCADKATTFRTKSLKHVSVRNNGVYGGQRKFYSGEGHKLQRGQTSECFGVREYLVDNIYLTAVQFLLLFFL